MASDEKPESQRQQQGMSDTVKVAIIAGVFGLITAIVTGFFGLAPSLVPLFLQSSTATATLSPTVATTDPPTPTLLIPTETPTLTHIPTATNTTTSAPTVTEVLTQAMVATTVPPTMVSSGTYPCDASIVYNRTGLLNIVRGGPSSRSSYRPPIQQGVAIRILSKDQETRDVFWYHIADADGEELAWIPIEYAVPSQNCPD